MTDNSEHLETNAAANSEQERFSEAYRRAMDGVTMSPQLRERVLRLQNKKPEPVILRVMRPVACAAACLVVVFAARSWIKTEQFSMDTATTTEAAARSVSSEAVASSAYADYAPETATETYGEADLPSSAALTADEVDGAAPEAAEEDGAAQDEKTGGAVPAEGSADSAAESPSAEPYVLGTHTDLPEEETASLPAEESDAEETVSANEEEEPAQENREEHSGKNGMDGGMMTIANPLVSYDSIEEAAAVLGWEVKLPPLPEDFSVTLISGELLQIDWNNGNSYYRMAKSELGADISGDYNSYPAVATVENGYALRLCGDEQDAYRLLTWQDGGYSYAYCSDSPMTADEAISLVEQILGR